MCIVALAWKVIDDMPLCIISNRDEYYARPTRALHHWPHHSMIAGQDELQGGTWMGITEAGRWAVITNFRDGHDKQVYSTSRGHLIQEFLQSEMAPIRFAQQLAAKQCDYAGFNLLLGDQKQAVYMSNRGEAPQLLPHGVYVLSNGLMHEPWEKTRHLRKRFTQELLPLLQQAQDFDIEYAVWDILEDQRQVETNLLPQTGISQEMEQLLSSTFIDSLHYGTRCSNFLTVRDRVWHWLEKTQYGPHRGQITKIVQAIT